MKTFSSFGGLSYFLEFGLLAVLRVVPLYLPSLSRLALEQCADSFSQMSIWELSCPHQILTITDKKPDGELQDHLHNLSPIPTILHVCQLSRKVALRIYFLVRGNILRRSMYYNKFQDVLLLENIRCMDMLLRDPLWVSANCQQSSVQNHIGHIAITYDGPFGFRNMARTIPPDQNESFQFFLSLAINIASALRSVTVVRPNFDNEESLSHASFNHSGSNNTGPEDTSTLVRRVILLLTEAEPNDYHRFLRALAMYVNGLGEKDKVQDEKQPTRADLNLTCCTLEQLKDSIK